ncbi:MAG: DDE-type integrase/transposase/recombinase [Geminicoccaceae bacterium]
MEAGPVSILRVPHPRPRQPTDKVGFRRRLHRVEQDHRRIKRLTRPMLGFGSFVTARRTLAGVEAMAMLAKGQVRAVPGNDMSAQRAFVHQIFGLAA